MNTEWTDGRANFRLCLYDEDGQNLAVLETMPSFEGTNMMFHDGEVSFPTQTSAVNYDVVDEDQPLPLPASHKIFQFDRLPDQDSSSDKKC